MTVHAGLPSLSRGSWDEMTGRNFYSSAGWLDFCATDYRMRVDGVLGGTAGGIEVAVPVSEVSALTGSPYDWTGVLTERGLPGVAGDGVLVGPREGYQTTLLRGTLQPSAEALADLLRALRAHAGDRPCVAMYLGTEDVRALRAAGVDAPAVLLECDAWIRVPEGGWSGWLDSLNAKRRCSVRHESKKFAEAGYVIRHVPLAECSELIAPLAASTLSKYGHDSSPEDELAALRNHERCLGTAARVALATLYGDLVGFCLYYVWWDTIFLRWAGFDYDRLRDAAEYFNLLYYEQLRWAGEHGIRWLHAGIKSTRAKAMRAATLRPLWLLDLTEDSPLSGAESVVWEGNASMYADLVTDKAIAAGIAEHGEWQPPD